MRIVFPLIPALIISTSTISQTMKRIYNREVTIGIERTSRKEPEIIREEDLNVLPIPVQNYLRYTGCIGKEKIQSVYLKFDAKLRSAPDRPWMKVEASQHSFFDNYTRLFFMKASMMGVPVRGLHVYKEGKASMRIRLMSLLPIIKEDGAEMEKSETVTFFNDMCLMAPAALIDPCISWELIDSLTVNAHFTAGRICISARLFFNLQGQLINFVSNDRSCFAGKHTFRKAGWSTPVKSYGVFDGRKLVSSAEAIWNFPEGDFCYGIFQVLEEQQNVQNIKIQ
jgi:hypothetical protein